MGKSLLIINAMIFILCISSSNSLSRALYYNQERCFYDNYYSSMNIVLTYKILDTDLPVPKGIAPRFKISIVATESAGDVKIFYGAKLSGKYSYAIEKSDKYKICIISEDKEAFGNKKFLHLQFQVETSDELYQEDTAKTKDFKRVNETMQNINKKIDQIISMQSYQLEVEDKFSTTQIHSSNLVAVLSLCQIIIICAVGVYHVFTLRKLFKEKIWTPF